MDIWCYFVAVKNNFWGAGGGSRWGFPACTIKDEHCQYFIFKEQVSNA